MKLPALAALHKTVSRVLDETDQKLKEYYNKNLEIHYKGAKDVSTSLVTQADLDVDQMLSISLQKNYPNIGFITEENSNGKIKEYNWIIDPLDGTLNFTSHIPIFCTSISLWKENEPLYTINSVPLLEERVHAFSGQGIFLNNKKVTRNPIPRNNSYFVYSNIEKPNIKLAYLDAIIDLIPFPRYLGSSVYHGILAATGRIDGAIFINNGLWDISGALLLAEESGLATTFISEPPTITDSQVRNYKHSFVIGEPALISQIKERLHKEFQI